MLSTLVDNNGYGWQDENDKTYKVTFNPLVGQAVTTDRNDNE